MISRKLFWPPSLLVLLYCGVALWLAIAIYKNIWIIHCVKYVHRYLAEKKNRKELRLVLGAVNRREKGKITFPWIMKKQNMFCLHFNPLYFLNFKFFYKSHWVFPSFYNLIITSHICMRWGFNLCSLITRSVITEACKHVLSKQLSNLMVVNISQARTEDKGW